MFSVFFLVIIYYYFVVVVVVVDPPTRCRQRRRCQVQGLFDGLIREWAQGAFEGVQQQQRNGEGPLEGDMLVPRRFFLGG